MFNVALEMNNPLKVFKADPAAAIDFDAAEKSYGDMLIEVKALKIKIDEHMKRPPEIEVVDQYSRFLSPSR